MSGTKGSDLLKSAGALFEFNRLVINALLSVRGGDEEIRDAIKSERMIHSVANLLCKTADVVMKVEAGDLTFEIYKKTVVAVETRRLRVELGDQLIAREVEQVVGGTVGWIVGFPNEQVNNAKQTGNILINVAFRDRHSECGQTFTVSYDDVEFASFKKGDRVIPDSLPVTPIEQMFAVLKDSSKDYRVARVMASNGRWILELEGVSGIYDASKFNCYKTYGA